MSNSQQILSSLMSYAMKTALLAACVGLTACTTNSTRTDKMQFNEAEIREAEKALEAALSSGDPMAWVEHYTEDAVFIAPGAAAVQGRDALNHMARAMRPLSSARIESIKTDGTHSLAAVYGLGSWVNGAGTATESITRVRLIIVWRKGTDGRWRVAQELLHPQPPAP
jgi:uncharacterized protein (TIGR02246 family)